MSQGLKNASEMTLYPSLTPFKASCPELREGHFCQGGKALTEVWLPGLASLLAWHVECRLEKIH